VENDRNFDPPCDDEFSTLSIFVHNDVKCNVKFSTLHGKHKAYVEVFF
jgi:hypothetical protein